MIQNTWATQTRAFKIIPKPVWPSPASLEECGRIKGRVIPIPLFPFQWLDLGIINNQMQKGILQLKKEFYLLKRNFIFEKGIIHLKKEFSVWREILHTFGKVNDNKILYLSRNCQIDNQIFSRKFFLHKWRNFFKKVKKSNSKTRSEPRLAGKNPKLKFSNHHDSGRKR